MRIGLKMFLVTGLGLVLVQAAGRAEDKPASADKPVFKDDKEKATYAIGMYFGNPLKRSGMDIDEAVAIGAMKEMLAGKEPKLTEQEAQTVIRSYQMESRKKVA